MLKNFQTQTFNLFSNDENSFKTFFKENNPQASAFLKNCLIFMLGVNNFLLKRDSL